MNSNQLHVQSSIVSETGFSLRHLSEEEFTKLKSAAIDLRRKLAGAKSYAVTDFDTLDEAIQLIKSTFVNLDAFLGMQVVGKVQVVNVELINDMISIAKGNVNTVPIELRVSSDVDGRVGYPKLEKLGYNSFIWLDLAIKTNFSQLIKRTFYVLGEHDES